MIHTAVVLLGWGLGFQIGKHFVSRWIERRRAERERRMINITPRRK